MEETKKAHPRASKKRLLQIVIKTGNRFNNLFHISPDFDVPKSWIEKRTTIYEANAQKLKVEAPKAKFYVCPTIEKDKKRYNSGDNFR